MEPFDWAKTAPLHSQLTGVLAGFVFAAIALLLSNQPDEEESDVFSLPLCLLLSVLFSLVICSFVYAVMAGESQDSRLAIASVLACFIFASAAVQMFCSMIWLFQAYRVNMRVVAYARNVFYAVVALAVFFTWETCLDSEARLGIEQTDWWCLAALGLLPLIGFLLKLRVSQGVGIATDSRASRWLSQSSCVFTLLLAACFGVVYCFPEIVTLLGGISFRWGCRVISGVLGMVIFLCQASVRGGVKLHHKHLRD